MKVAIVHDSLVEFGGSERSIQSLLEIFPDAHVYTAYQDSSLVRRFFPKLSAVHFHTSWAQGNILSSRASLFQLFSPLIWRNFNFSKYDVVISSSHSLLSNLINTDNVVHIQYIHSPPKNLFGLSPQAPLHRLIPYSLRFIGNFYRRALRSSTHVVVDSNHMRRTILKLFGVNSRVIYPPVIIPPKPPIKHELKYFLCVSRIDWTKNLEIAIEACSSLGLPLKIVGKSNDKRYENYLRSLAGPTVQFLGFRSDEEIDKLYQSAIAFVFPSKNEDFGIAPVEAMAHGVPVIAYYGGGPKETIISGKTGAFFYEHNSLALAEALKGFKPELFKTKNLYQHALKFNADRFKSEMKQYVYEASRSR